VPQDLKRASGASALCAAFVANEEDRYFEGRPEKPLDCSDGGTLDTTRPMPRLQLRVTPRLPDRGAPIEALDAARDGITRCLSMEDVSAAPSTYRMSVMRDAVGDAWVSSSSGPAGCIIACIHRALSSAHFDLPLGKVFDFSLEVSRAQ
jgi:hypothetical protein